MTEAEWLATRQPYDLTHHKASRSERKRRLLACACARRVLDLVPDGRYLDAVVTAERHADGAATQDEVRAARRLITRLLKDQQFTEAGNHAATAALATLSGKGVDAVHGLESAAAARAAEARPRWDAGLGKETRAQCQLARDVFANPFRPVTFSPSWHTSTAVALASQMYESRDFGPMPILADALQDAGCDDVQVLAHCRGDAPHVRGCWVVDLVLGKA